MGFFNLMKKPGTQSLSEEHISRKYDEILPSIDDEQLDLTDSRIEEKEKELDGLFEEATELVKDNSQLEFTPLNETGTLLYSELIDLTKDNPDLVQLYYNILFARDHEVWEQKFEKRAHEYYLQDPTSKYTQDILKFRKQQLEIRLTTLQSISDEAALLNNDFLLEKIQDKVVDLQKAVCHEV